MSGVDPWTADTLRDMARYSRWPDAQIARYLAIDEVHVKRARKLVRRGNRNVCRVDKRNERNP